MNPTIQELQNMQRLQEKFLLQKQQQLLQQQQQQQQQQQHQQQFQHYNHNQHQNQHEQHGTNQQNSSQQHFIMNGIGMGSNTQETKSHSNPLLINQQWMDTSSTANQSLPIGYQNFNTSFAGLNQHQRLTTPLQGNQYLANNRDLNSLSYWNTGNCQGISSSGMDINATNSLSLSRGNIMGAPTSNIISMESQLQALLPQSHVGNNPNQASLVRGATSHLTNQANDLSNSMPLMTQHQELIHQLTNNHSMQGDSEGSNLSGRTDLQAQSNGDSVAMMLLKQQNMIADLQRRLQAQQCNSSSNLMNMSSTRAVNSGAPSSSFDSGMSDFFNVSSITQHRSNHPEMALHESLSIQDVNAEGTHTISSVIKASAQGGSSASSQKISNDSFCGSDQISQTEHTLQQLNGGRNFGSINAFLVSLCNPCDDNMCGVVQLT
jgi:hypothetical protein